MSTMSLGVPPLPPGWTEHISPAGQLYYYNTQTNQSTYIRPLPGYPAVPQAAPAASSKKKEKPLVKTPIPGTEWLRVKTTEGNIFYTNKVKKESLWVIPEEIKDAVRLLEENEEADVAEQEMERLRLVEEESQREIERIKSEVQEVVKRKADETSHLDEIVISKKARVEEEVEEGAEGEEDGSDGDDDEDEVESEEEEWQRAAAAQLAAEAEEFEETKRQEEARVAKERELAQAEFEAKKTQLNMPERVDLSVDEAKALFKTLLREKDINPLQPWDKSLPLFISDPRYVLLPSVSARRDAFDEYCKERVREKRQQEVQLDKEANPKEEFNRLLAEEIKSTRTLWSDFRRTWKKDRRFWGWGRDDREREKRFKEYLKELGEKKRAAAQKAESAFFVLLKEYKEVQQGSLWKDVKRKVSHDSRYDAIGSSSLREELFNTFMKAQFSSSSDRKETANISNNVQPTVSSNAVDAEQQRKEKRERAVKEREEKVKSQLGRVEADIGRSKMGLSREEGEREFRTLLTDAVRDPQATWDSMLSQLKTDPRFIHSLLPINQQIHLFQSHMKQVHDKHINSLHSLFEAHSPTLATPFSELPLESLRSSLPVTKLGLSSRRLEEEYDMWQRDRTQEARTAFDEMLNENSFVEFWGRLGKIGGEGVDGGVKADELGEDEGEGFGGRVDMKALAKNVDITDMEKVLKNDKRYIMFQHVPEQRERWLRNYWSKLSAPKLSVHVK